MARGYWMLTVRALKQWSSSTACAGSSSLPTTFSDSEDRSRASGGLGCVVWPTKRVDSVMPHAQTAEQLLQVCAESEEDDSVGRIGG